MSLIFVLTEWAQRLRFIDSSPVVKEYQSSSSAALVPYQSQNAVIPVYNVRWGNQSKVKVIYGPQRPEPQLTLEMPLPSVQFAALSALGAGPQSILGQISGECTNCKVTGLTLVLYSVFFLEFPIHVHISTTLDLNEEHQKLPEGICFDRHCIDLVMFVNRILF